MSSEPSFEGKNIENLRAVARDAQQRLLAAESLQSLQAHETNRKERLAEARKKGETPAYFDTIPAEISPNGGLVKYLYSMPSPHSTEE